LGKSLWKVYPSGLRIGPGKLAMMLEAREFLRVPVVAKLRWNWRKYMKILENTRYAEKIHRSHQKS